jgi:hypothetical protein
MNGSNPFREFKPATVPDLLSFDSWEHSSTAAPPSIQETFSAATDSLAEEEEEDSNQRTTESRQPPPSRVSPSDVKLNISGADYVVNQAVFRKLQALPWRYEPITEAWNLHTSPYLFEILLQYVTFGVVPDASRLCSTDLEELVPMTMVLGWEDLQMHLEQRKKPLLSSKRRLLRRGGSGVKDWGDPSQTSQRPTPQTHSTSGESTNLFSNMAAAWWRGSAGRSRGQRRAGSANGRGLSQWSTHAVE